MSHQTLTFIFGALLLLIGIIGGGFEVKELKLPKVGWFIRLTSIIIGAFFIAISLDVIEVPRLVDDNSVAKKINELNGQIRHIDLTIQNIKEELASLHGPTAPIHELQDISQEREKRLMDIESLQANLRAETEQLHPYKNSDPDAKRRIEQINEETISDLETEKRAVRTQLQEIHDLIRIAAKKDELRGRINELKKQKQSMLEEIERLTGHIQSTLNSND